MLTKNDIERPNIKDILTNKYVIKHMEKYLHSKIQILHPSEDKLIYLSIQENSSSSNDIFINSDSTNMDAKEEKKDVTKKSPVMKAPPIQERHKIHFRLYKLPSKKISNSKNE